MSNIIYKSDSQIVNPRNFVREFARDLRKTKEIGWRFFLSNIKSQFRQNWLGYLWIIIPPLGTTLLWVYLSRAKIINTNTKDIPYPVFVLSGVFLWQAFVESLNSPLQRIQSARWILTKINVPHEAFFVAGLSETIFNLLVRLIVLIFAFVWYGIAFQTTWFLIPFGIFSILLFGFAIGLLITPIGLLYKDITNGLSVLVTFWFFVTPIIYNDAEFTLVKFNPMTPLLITTRNWMINGTFSPVSGFFLVTGLSFGITIFGLVFYRLSKPHLVARI